MSKCKNCDDEVSDRLIKDLEKKRVDLDLALVAVRTQLYLLKNGFCGPYCYSVFHGGP